MPVHKKDGKWYWGTKGPFDDKAKAEAVGRAAYANGYANDSARIVDGNGYVTVEGNPISKEGVYDYLGSEIPGYPGDPNDVVKVYRPASELSSQETIDSFKLMPFIIDHTWLGDEGTDPGELPMSGMTGEQVYWDPPFLRSNIRWFSERVKEALDSGKLELSPAYKWDVYLKPGVFEGQPYQYVQRNLRGNHLALIDTGRTGEEVAVMDAAPEKNMNFEEILKAIAKMDAVQRAALCAALKASGGEEEVVTETAAVDDEAVVETDAAKPDPAVAAVEDAKATDADADPAKAEDVGDPAKAMDAMAKRIKQLEGQVAKGMDTGALMKAIGDRNELGERVSKHVGAFAMDSMTILQVAEYGIKKLGIKAPKGQEVATLNGYLTALESAPEKTVAFAQDKKATTQQSTVGDALKAL